MYMLTSASILTSVNSGFSHAMRLPPCLILGTLPDGRGLVQTSFRQPAFRPVPRPALDFRDTMQRFDFFARSEKNFSSAPLSIVSQLES